MRHILESYYPDLDLPLLVSFSNHMKANGYYVEIDFDLFDLKIYDKNGELVLGAVSVKGFIGPSTIFALGSDDIPHKVVLVESATMSMDEKVSAKLFLSKIDVSIYVRNTGWLFLFDDVVEHNYQDWGFRVLPRYSQDSHGIWHKKCVICDESKVLSEFYRRARYKGLQRDPYRNVCKACWKVRYAQKGT